MTSDDFIPLNTASDDLPTSVTDSTVKKNTNGSIIASNLADRLKMARVTMEGPERAIARERNEKNERINNQLIKLNEELALVNKRKEDLEIGWVVLDNKRNDFKKVLAPILAEEEKAELHEGELEGKEQTTLLPSERQKIEKERWQAQEERRKIEVKKWELEDKIAFLENQIADNTKKYQELLDQEEKIQSEINTAQEELNIMAEQERLELEDKHRREILEAERHQKEILAKKESTTTEQPKEAATKTISDDPLSKTNTPAPIKSEKTREDLLKEAEDNRRRMQEEIARITGNLNMTTANSTPAVATPAVAPTNIPVSPLKEMAIEVKSPTVEKATPASTVTTPTPEPAKKLDQPIKINIIRQASPVTDDKIAETIKSEGAILEAKIPTKPVETYHEPITDNDLVKKDIAVETITSTSSSDPSSFDSLIHNQEDNLPKMRTLQTDLANLKNQSK